MAQDSDARSTRKLEQIGFKLASGLVRKLEAQAQSGESRHQVAQRIVADALGERLSGKATEHLAPEQMDDLRSVLGHLVASHTASFDKRLQAIETHLSDLNEFLPTLRSRINGLENSARTTHEMIDLVKELNRRVREAFIDLYDLRHPGAPPGSGQQVVEQHLG